ncbi:MAG: hypothetical protein AAFV53_10295 [Myxococcota bacterium]
MALIVTNVSLIRKTDIPEDDAVAFLRKALEQLSGSDPGEVEWQHVNRMERGRPAAMEYTTTESWQPGPMVDVRRVRVESFGRNEEDDELELRGSRISYAVRCLPDDGSMEYRVDNTRLKGASLEVYAPKETADQVAATFREMFTEA